MAEMAIGKFRFDPDTGVLRGNDDTEVSLRHQSASVLSLLATKPGALFSKETLFETIWCGVAVTDGSLTQCIADIRRVLQDEDHRIVQNVSKRGYRLQPASNGAVAKGGGDDAMQSAATPLEQAPVRFASAPDGTRLAWTISGRGVPILMTPSWICNIEMEARSLLFTDFYERLGRRARVARFDQRGMSLSDRVSAPLTVDAMVEDIRTVADAAGLERFFIYGPSQGVAFAIAFADRYPERVLGLIGRGGFAKGCALIGGAAGRTKYDIGKALIKNGWDTDNPEYRRFFTARLIPDASPAISREFDQMQKLSVDSAAMLANFELMCFLDVEEEARRIPHPVLLLQSRGDRAVDCAEGIRLAAMMRNAQFVLVDGDNHIFLPDSQGIVQALDAIDAFLDRHRAKVEST